MDPKDDTALMNRAATAAGAPRSSLFPQQQKPPAGSGYRQQHQSPTIPVRSKND